MKKIIFIISIFCVLTFSSKGQGTLRTLTSLNVSDLSNYISANYKLKEKTLDTLCLYTTVFMKFKVAANGKIADLTLSEKTPDVIKKGLVKAIESSNGHWSNLDTDLEYFSKKTFVLPIVLFYGRGCEVGNGELEINISEERRAEEYRKLDNTARNANYAVMDILKFNGKYLSMLECVILSPLTMGATGY
ncbi:hypothetical protein [Pedobacter sp. BMA]|uniref:hypothetical protein n=1 Tax=Pedobacter sp. BMA TaxID=1663685 RepID=UPI000A920788|nr:hypothetical protein [Pedobacter sp. BMA]